MYNLYIILCNFICNLSVLYIFDFDLFPYQIELVYIERTYVNQFKLVGKQKQRQKYMSRRPIKKWILLRRNTYFC